MAGPFSDDDPHRLSGVCWSIGFYRDGVASSRSQATKATLRVVGPFTPDIDFGMPAEQYRLDQVCRSLDAAHREGKIARSRDLKRLLENEDRP